MDGSEHLEAADGGWPALIADFVAHERAVGGFAEPTLRHRDLYMRTFARWWESTHPGRHPSETTTADLSCFLIAEDDRGMGAYTRKAQVAVHAPREIATILAHTSALQDLRGRLRHTIVATLRFTGMRSGELRTLRRDHLDEVRPELPTSPLMLSNPSRLVTTPHRWRTYATELVRAGVDIHLVQRLPGHRTITSTVGYTNLVADDLKDAVDDLW